MSEQTVLQILRNQVIPWAMAGATQRFIVARPTMRAADMPEGVTLSRRKLSGKRVSVKERRIHGNQRLHTATWPDDNLHEIAVPKIMCVVEGAADFFISKYTVYCGKGYFHIIPPEMPHQRFGPFLAGPQNGYCRLLQAYAYSQGILFWPTISYNGEHINNTHENYLISNITLARLLELVTEEAVANETDSEVLCNNYLTAFLTLVAREIENGNYILLHGSRQSIHAPVPSHASFAQQVQEYVEANCHRMLRVEDVAKHMHMSNSHFFRRMQQETGITFVELLIRCRMEHACQLLCDTNLTVMSIASKLSFKSPSYFQTLFHTRMGCTPIEYRNRTREKR